MDKRAFMQDMIRTELEDVVGEEHVSTKESEKITYA